MINAINNILTFIFEIYLPLRKENINKWFFNRKILIGNIFL